MILFDCSRQKNQDLLSTYLSKDTLGSSPRILGSLIYCYPVLYMFDGYLLDALKVDVKDYKKVLFYRMRYCNNLTIFNNKFLLANQGKLLGILEI